MEVADAPAPGPRLLPPGRPGPLPRRAPAGGGEHDRLAAAASASAGETGRVLFHRLDESCLLVGVVERDEAERVPPSAEALALGWRRRTACATRARRPRWHRARLADSGLVLTRGRRLTTRCRMHARTLTIAYTPDSDDAFYYFALETGRVRAAGLPPRVPPRADERLEPRRPRRQLRRDGDLVGRSIRRSPTATPSSASAPASAAATARCWSAGSLATLADLRGRRVGVAGIPTTGWFLLRWLCPEAVPVEMPFDRSARRSPPASSTPA